MSRRIRKTPLAWSNLVHDPKRLAASLAGISFAVVLIFTELGFLNALLESTVAPIATFQSADPSRDPARHPPRQGDPGRLAPVRPTLADPGRGSNGGPLGPVRLFRVEPGVLAQPSYPQVAEDPSSVQRFPGAAFGSGAAGHRSDTVEPPRNRFVRHPFEADLRIRRVAEERIAGVSP